MSIILHGESLNWFVRQRPLLFHDQSWYRAEPFAGAAVSGVFGEADPMPAAAYAKAFVEAFDCDGTLLWSDHYRWTTDFDTEGHPVYVGRAAQYGGLQIHRRLTEDIR